MNFQFFWRNSKWHFQGFFKSIEVFPGVIKKKCGISRGLCFWCLKLQRHVTHFFEVSRGEALFSLEFPGVKWRKNKKFQRCFFLKKVLNPTPPAYILAYFVCQVTPHPPHHRHDQQAFDGIPTKIKWKIHTLFCIIFQLRRYF